MNSNYSIRWVVSAGTLLVTFLISLHSHADVQACVDAHSAGQDLRDQGKFLESEQRFLTCAEEECPGPIRLECDELLSQVRASTPTLVIAARDANGTDVSGVKLLVDGVPVDGAFAGRPTPMDPGAHTFLFEHPNGAVEEVELVVQEGERGRPLVVRFSEVRVTADADVASGNKAASDADAPFVWKEEYTAWALGGAGVIAVATSVIVGLSAGSERERLQTQCAPDCPQAEVDSLSSQLLIADLALVAGALSIGGGAYLYFSTDAEPSPGDPARVTSLGFAGRF